VKKKLKTKRANKKRQVPGKSRGMEDQVGNRKVGTKHELEERNPFFRKMPLGGGCFGSRR